MTAQATYNLFRKIFVNYWSRYVFFVENAIMGNVTYEKNDITYWRERLFTNLIIYLFPICLVALIPGVIISIKLNYLFVASFDLFVPCSIAIITFNKRLSLSYKKTFVVFMLYCLAIVLIIYLGLFGPGIVYLLALSVIITLIYPGHFAYWSVAFNVFICIVCSLVISYKWFHSPLIEQYNLGTWIAISSNLVFLSGVIVVLISSTINRLEDTIIKELHLKDQLHRESRERLLINQKLSESEAHFKGQNIKLQEIAYIQSHYVRAPLARILGLVDLINTNKAGKYDPELMEYLDQSARDLDEIIKEITQNAELVKV